MPNVIYDWNMKMILDLLYQFDSYSSIEQENSLIGLLEPNMYEVSQPRSVINSPDALETVLRSLTAFIMETLYK